MRGRWCLLYQVSISMTMETTGIPHFLNSPEGVYSAAIALLLFSMILYQFSARLKSFLTSSRFLSSSIRPFFLNHIIYARSYGRLLGLHSVSRVHMILAGLYFIGTGICNFVYVDSIAIAGSRAAYLCLVNLTPTFLAGGFEFGAQILGVSLRIYGFIHRIFACVAFIEGMVHFIIIARTRALSWSIESQFYGLLVRPLSFMEDPGNNV